MGETGHGHRSVPRSLNDKTLDKTDHADLPFSMLDQPIGDLLGPRMIRLECAIEHWNRHYGQPVRSKSARCTDHNNIQSLFANPGNGSRYQDTHDTPTNDCRLIIDMMHVRSPRATHRQSQRKGLSQ